MLSEREREHRWKLWEALKDKGGPFDVPARLLRELGIYSGQQGVWINKQRTQSISSKGVTVSLKHTGRHYPDDLSTDGVIYHYPVTLRRGHDESEVAATKEAQRLEIPVFVITETANARRNVYLGQVVDWDDLAKQFFVEFIQNPAVAPVQEVLQSPFRAFDETERGIGIHKLRPGQARFKFETVKRYGPRCAFCDIQVTSALDAVHLISKAEKGSDDARNGLVLCATHHRILDSGLVRIHPDTLNLEPQAPYSLIDLFIRHDSIGHLSEVPDHLALDWCWKNSRTDNSS
jgi:hypothetical protein